MYRSEQVTRILSGIVFLAVLLLICATLLIAHRDITLSRIASIPIATSSPDTRIAYTTPPVAVQTPRRTVHFASSTESRQEIISQAPREVVALPLEQSKQTATVLTTIPAPEKKQRYAIGFNANAMLEAHNGVRKKHNLPLLTWSDALAQSSREWGKTLVRRGCDFYHDPDTEYGENLYWQWISDSNNTELISSPEEAVTWWADEIRYYNYAKNTCRKGKDCGHYTQLVWAETTEVGCSVHTCFDADNDDTQTDLWVCRYDPPGNIEGEKPY